MPFTYPTRTCPFCGYPLDGLEWKTHNAVQCPECGQLANPDRLYLLTTKKELHTRLILRLLLPTALPTGLIAIGIIFNDLFMFLGCCAIPFMFMANFIIFLTTTRSIYEDTMDEPRPVPRWEIPLWTLLYITPGIVLYIILLAIMAGRFP